MKYIII